MSTTVNQENPMPGVRYNSLRKWYRVKAGRPECFHTPDPAKACMVRMAWEYATRPVEQINENPFQTPPDFSLYDALKLLILRGFLTTAQAVEGAYRYHQAQNPLVDSLQT